MTDQVVPRFKGPQPKPKKRKRVNPVSERRAAENVERRAAAMAKWGRYPDCQLCQPLRDHGVSTGCSGKADDLDEMLRRSAGGSITDLDNCRPVGRRCHDWIGSHPREAIEWGLVQSRWQQGGNDDVNPSHLELGTQAENMADAVERHRIATGARNARTKFTDDEVAEIRRRWADDGARQVDLAAEFGVSTSHISRICTGQRRG